MGCIEVKLTRGMSAVIDEEDAWVLKHKWCVNINRNLKKYVQRWKGNAHVSMHREILGLERGDGKQVDHINGDGLDNRRCNIRVASASLNNHNKKKKKGTSSKYRGVSWQASSEKWRAKTKFNKKEYPLGYFDNEKQAAEAYNKKVTELYGDQARLNVL